MGLCESGGTECEREGRGRYWAWKTFDGMIIFSIAVVRRGFCRRRGEYMGGSASVGLLKIARYDFGLDGLLS